MKLLLLTPMVWLISAGLLFAVAVGLGYHQDQKVAVEAMSKPRGPAPLVTIQSFDAEAHSNLAGDVRLVAEVDFARVYEIEFGPADARETAVLIPLYPVGDAGWQALRREVEGKTTPRPVLRADRPGRLPTPVGAIFSRTPHNVARNLDLDALVARRIGAGTSGSVVEIAGVERSGFMETSGVVPMRGPFPMQMGANPVIVEPFDFARPGALIDNPHGSERLVLTRLGLVFLLLAALLAVRPRSRRRPNRKVARSAETSEPRQSTPHRRFQPIATQDEIFVAESEAAEAQDRARRAQGWIAAMPFKSRR